MHERDFTGSILTCMKYLHSKTGDDSGKTPSPDQKRLFLLDIRSRQFGLAGVELDEHRIGALVQRKQQRATADVAAAIPYRPRKT